MLAPPLCNAVRPGTAPPFAPSLRDEGIIGPSLERGFKRRDESTMNERAVFRAANHGLSEKPR
jgi:hypothetical protein